MNAQKGFTLIELMMVIAVLAVLVAIAVPSYNGVMLKSRRAEAKTGLLQASQGLERCYTRFSAYNDAGCDVATVLEGDGIATEEGWYLVTGAVNANDFSLTATPQGSQTEDSGCANFTYDQIGQRGVSGTYAVEDCW